MVRKFFAWHGFLLKIFKNLDYELDPHINIFISIDILEALEICLECREMSTQCGCENHKKHVSISSDTCGYRQRLFSIHLDGNPKTLNPNLSMNEQVKSIKYNPKLEIDRSNFIVGKILGAGNFGCVFEGKMNSFFMA